MKSMYVNLNGDQDKKEREALLKALSYQSRPISSCPFKPFALRDLEFELAYAHLCPFLTI
jgi:hypothetical protein